MISETLTKSIAEYASFLCFYALLLGLWWPVFFQKSTFYAGIKFFNSLPPSLTILENNKAKFKAALRKYLHTHPADEFF